MSNTPEETDGDADVDTEEEGMTLFDAVGGMPFFERLVDAFYEGVMPDPVLGPLYPPDDVDGARHRLTLFLAQYWGGPHTYMEERGHPMLRMRHNPFAIGAAERDHWLLHMAAAVERCTPPGEIRDMLMGYFVPAAEHMRNDGNLNIVRG